MGPENGSGTVEVNDELINQYRVIIQNLKVVDSVKKDLLSTLENNPGNIVNAIEAYTQEA